MHTVYWLTGNQWSMRGGFTLTQARTFAQARVLHHAATSWYIMRDGSYMPVAYWPSTPMVGGKHA
jgi:hypothetical protein